MNQGSRKLYQKRANDAWPIITTYLLLLKYFHEQIWIINQNAESVASRKATI